MVCVAQLMVVVPKFVGTVSVMPLGCKSGWECLVTAIKRFF